MLKIVQAVMDLVISIAQTVKDSVRFEMLSILKVAIVHNILNRL